MGASAYWGDVCKSLWDAVCWDSLGSFSYASCPFHTELQNDSVFGNNSSKPQISVEEQLAIVLYWFGHDGNAASIKGVANWAVVGKGTILLVTCRVMTAILWLEFMDEAVYFPNAEEKKAAKKWVHRHSCKAWHNSWCLIDGTLIPLAEWPHWFGESYFDWKNWYSLNIQACICPESGIYESNLF